MTDLQHLLDQIDRLDQEATKGPWAVDKDNPRGIHDPLVIYPPEDDGGVIAYVQPDQDDAEFIVLARTALPSLARALQAVIESCEESIRSVDKNLLPDEGDHAKRHHADMVLDAITDSLGADHD